MNLLGSVPVTPCDAPRTADHVPIGVEQLDCCPATLVKIAATTNAAGTTGGPDCHPERSEGSTSGSGDSLTISLAALGMTACAPRQKSAALGIRSISTSGQEDTNPSATCFGPPAVRTPGAASHPGVTL